MDDARIDTLVSAAQAGDREAFTQLVIEFYPQLTGFLAFHAPTRELIDELAQATLVTAFEKIGSFEPRGSFAGWLKGIARNLLRRELVRRVRVTSNDVEALESLLADTAREDLERAKNASDQREDMLSRLRTCFEKLSPRMRQIAERRFIDEVPLNRLAQQFKQSRASIAKILFVTKRDLRQCAEAQANPG